MVTVVREAIVEREDDAFIQICCDWTKTIFFSPPLALQIKHKPTICHVVSYVCLFQQLRSV